MHYLYRILDYKERGVVPFVKPAVSHLDNETIPSEHLLCTSTKQISGIFSHELLVLIPE